MKVRASVKPICEKCKVIKRKGKIRIICERLSARIPSTNRDRVKQRVIMCSLIPCSFRQCS